MEIDDLSHLVEPLLTECCSVRTFLPGDEQAWADIMNTGIGSGWTVETVREQLTGQPQFRPEGLFFVIRGGRAVASACAWVLDPAERETGILHMVCARPEARGLGLGYALTLMVLRYFRDRGFRRVRLSTDSSRPSAIRAYLHAGFRPLYEEENDREVWESLMESLGGYHPSSV